MRLFLAGSLFLCDQFANDDAFTSIQQTHFKRSTSFTTGLSKVDIFYYFLKKHSACMSPAFYI